MIAVRGVASCRRERLGAALEAEQHAPRHEKRGRFRNDHG
jgi:hypothetical protein